jgi:hypothetical protein
MPFDTLSERLKIVANGSLARCRGEWGANGLKIERPIAAQIGWEPTFFLKPRETLIVAVEVNDLIFPEVLKSAAHDIEHYDFPIAVFQACSLDVYQSDVRLARVNLLRDHGFGLITVDDQGAATIQTRAAPYAQHISPTRFEPGLKSLTPTLKVKFREAYSTYQTDTEQGLQQAAKIVEGLVLCISTQAEKDNKIPPGTSRRDAAVIVDILYSTSTFENYRAALGGVRNFLRTYRNPPSHAARTAKAAAEKIRMCKAGFSEALRMAGELRSLIQRVGYRVVVH